MKVPLACVASAALSLPALARAAAPIDVSAEGCSLDRRELERLVRLELGSVLERGAASRVHLGCSGASMRMRIEDPLTRKALERTVRAPDGDAPEPERLVALGVAQLYRAAWLELLTEDPPPLAPEPPRSPPPSAVVEAARGVVRARVPATHAQLSIRASLRGGVELRGLQTRALGLPSVGLDVALSPIDRLWIGLGAGLGAYTAERSSGLVSTRLVYGHAIIAFEALRSGRWSGFAALDVGVGYASLRGRDVAAGRTAGQVEGPGLDSAIGLGGAARFGALRLELMARGGVLVGTPAGRVDGDASVDLDGAWIGLSAGIGVAF